MSRLLETRCDLCGSWMWCGRACSKDPRNEPEPVPMNGFATDPVNTVNTVNKLTKAELAIDKVEARKAYMRDKMRARRAAARAAKASTPA